MGPIQSKEKEAQLFSELVLETELCWMNERERRLLISAPLPGHFQFNEEWAV